MYPAAANYYYSSYPHYNMPPSPLYQPLPYNYYYYYPYPVPQPFHPHPPFPGAYHVPPPHYDYDNKNNHHCCGCNHPPKVDHNKTTTSSNNDSSFLLKDQYPISPDYTQPKAKDKEIHSLQPSKQPTDYPILWLPKDNSHEPVSLRRGGEDIVNPFPFKIFWLPDQLGNDTTRDLADDKIVENNNNTASGETSKKHVAQKVIPVKQASTKEEKKNPKCIETKVNMEKTEDGSRASPKASKLPPVCLRVDPLPRKKKTSRSPSPPADKQRSNNVATGKIDESEKGKVEEKKKSLSEDEAALIIQSAYRGFEVRKSQPLKKLRQIYEVKKQVLELRNRIQELETSSSANRIDGKKQVIIGETIMTLLLKLDTIQGLHPFVREVRKSVAKELVGLQERLDSLVKSEILRPQQIMHPEDEKLDQAQARLGMCENQQEKYTESRCNDSIREPQLELHKEKLNQALGESNEALESGSTESQVESHKEEKPTECEEAVKLCEKPTECDDAMESCEKPTECDEALESCEKPAERDEALQSCEKPAECDDTVELCEKPTECDDALESCEKPAECDDTVELCDKPTECDEAVESCEKPAECDEAVESCEKPAECDEALESCEKPAECDEHEKPTECDEAVELCENPAECGNAREKPTECDYACEKTDNGVVEADDMKRELSDNTSIMEMKSAAKANEGSDENKKAMEELMNQQLSVIRELTERVKDLEKKLSKKQRKKKMKVNKCRRSNDYVVE